VNVGIYCRIKKSRAAKSGSAFRYSLIKLMIFSEVCLTCSARLRSRNEHQVSVRLLDRYPAVRYQRVGSGAVGMVVVGGVDEERRSHNSYHGKNCNKVTSKNLV